MRLSSCVRQMGLAVALSSVVVGAAWAAQPSDKSIAALLGVTQSEQLMEDMSARMAQSMHQSMMGMFQNQKLNARQMEVLDSMSREMGVLVRDEMSWEVQRPQIVKIYQSVFTQKEVDAQIAFYRSAAGQSMVKKMPQVTEQSMALMQDRMKIMMPRFQALAEKAAAQVQELKSDPAPAAP